MAERFKKLRYRIAYLLASDWIDDLEYRFSVLLCEVTHGRMSKCYYTVEAMISEVMNCRMQECDECEFRKEAADGK